MNHRPHLTDHVVYIITCRVTHLTVYRIVSETMPFIYTIMSDTIYVSSL